MKPQNMDLIYFNVSDALKKTDFKLVYRYLKSNSECVSHGQINYHNKILIFSKKQHNPS